VGQFPTLNLLLNASGILSVFIFNYIIFLWLPPRGHTFFLIKKYAKNQGLRIS